MLFNSYIFVLVFLPIVWSVFFLLGKYESFAPNLWLAAASLFFYGYWDSRYLILLIASISFNYIAGIIISRQYEKRKNARRLTLIVAIATNLSLLAYYKYANFFFDNLNEHAGLSVSLGTVILPLGISFFTFTQIAYLVDCFHRKALESNGIRYLLFVTYFPHLIAGPVLHHAEMMPQFANRHVSKINWENCAVGLSIFILGLFKKVFLADWLSDFSTPVFDSADSGGHPMLIEAWVGATAYALQLYFDFSAYSDMAIGLSLMFNVRLPLNFNSPYKAQSIIDFWRCWHITLSRFLRDYLYIPLGGGRVGPFRRYLNLLITMVLGGLWHGAGWTFIIWGGLHGGFLLLNHAWRSYKKHVGWKDGGTLAKMFATALTFSVVVFAWVFFRASNFSSAKSILNGMLGLNGLTLPVIFENSIGQMFPGTKWIVFNGWGGDFSVVRALPALIVGLFVIWFLPNIKDVFGRHRPVCKTEKDLESELEKNFERFTFQWRPSLSIAVVLGITMTFAMLIVGSGAKSEFLYFQF